MAFDHLFDVDLDDEEAQRITHRFKRARSQILPIFSSMVVSPFERERQIALTLLARIGGQTTAKMLDAILADEEVHDAFKLDVRRLRDRLQPDASDEDDEDDELEDREAEDERPRREDEDEAEVDEEQSEQAVGQPSETATSTETEADSEEPPPRSRRRRAGRGRGRRAGQEQPAEATAATIDPKVFDGDPLHLLPHLEGPIEPVMQAFGQVALPKRLSFVDRSGRLEDRRILTFLLPLLQTDEWALVQSALRAIGQLGFPEAMPEVEKLVVDSSRKRVKLRAERVRDQLLESDKQAGPTPPSDADSAPQPVAAEPAAPAERQPQREKPQPKRRPRGEADSVQTPSAADEFGLLTPPPPDPRPAPDPPLQLPLRLPKLGTCLASGIAIDGSQRLQVYRQSETVADGKALDLLDLRIHGTVGWLDLAFCPGLDPQAPKQAQELAAERGEALVEVTVGYLRGRLIEACDLSKGSGRQLPAQAEEALALVGSGRRQDLAAELPEQPSELSQDKVEELLNAPWFAGWHLLLAADGGAVRRWEQTTGKRSASRVRRRLIDDVARAWHQTGIAPLLVDLLRRQAVVLQRAGRDALAETALACAVSLQTDSRHPERDLLLRELVYRGFQSGLDRSEAGRERAERAEFLAGRRNTLARSPFQRGLRRRGR